MITKLEKDQIFVFGSNLAGRHGAGAALYAYMNFGAIPGKGEGFMGQSYAIPTKDRNIKTLPLSDIKTYVSNFLIYAKDNPDKTFLVTEIGCGLAGYKPKDIAPFFVDTPLNVILPKSFKLCL